MSDRKEPTVSSILDGKEELAERRARAAQQLRRSTATSPTTTKTIVKSGSSGFTWFVFFLTLCIGAAAGYAVWQLDVAQKTMKDQRLRIVQLENKLAISDDSANQSLASVSAQVRELNSKTIQADSEIAKLWATRNVNRDAIAEESKKIVAVDKKIATLAQAQTKISTLEKALSNLEASVTELSSFKSTVSSTAQSVAEQDILLRAIKEKVAVQSELLKTLGSQANKGVSASNKLGDIEKRLKETEEALTSLEAFRRTTNRDLLQLKKPK